MRKNIMAPTVQGQICPDKITLLEMVGSDEGIENV
jgi:hypothetical protein